MSNLIKIFITSLAIVFCQISFAAENENKTGKGMVLDNALSSISFVSIKNGSVGETHTFDKLSGSFSPEGDLLVTIDLSSVKTKIDIRNYRMKKYFFEVEKNPSATITAKVGEVTNGVSRISGTLELNFHGVKKNLDFEVIAVLSDNKLVVSSAKPIILSASDYGLEEGIVMLQKLAKLSSIVTAVPVGFVMTFSRNK